MRLMTWRKALGARREGSLRRSSSLLERRSRADAAERAGVAALRCGVRNRAVEPAASCVVLSSSRSGQVSVPPMSESFARGRAVQVLRDEKDVVLVSFFRGMLLQEDAPAPRAARLSAGSPRPGHDRAMRRIFQVFCCPRARIGAGAPHGLARGRTGPYELVRGRAAVRVRRRSAPRPARS